jgi:hypothetical protein
VLLTGTGAELAQLQVAFALLSIGVPTLRPAALLACTLGATAGLLDGEATAPILCASTFVAASSMLSSSQAGSFLAPAEQGKTSSSSSKQLQDSVGNEDDDAFLLGTDVESQAQKEPTLLEMWEKEYGLQVPPSGNPVEWSVDDVVRALSAQVGCVCLFVCLCLCVCVCVCLCVYICICIVFGAWMMWSEL